VTIDRRENCRYWVNETVEICRLQNDIRIQGRIENISRNGMGLAIPLPVLSGEAVEIRSKHLRHLAEVRYCRRCGDRYLLGLEFCHEILNAEIKDVRTHQKTEPESPQSYLEKLPAPLPGTGGAGR